MDIDYHFHIMVSRRRPAPMISTSKRAVMVDANNRVTAKTTDLGDVNAPVAPSTMYTYSSSQLAGTLSNPVTLFSFADLIDGGEDTGDDLTYEGMIDQLAPLALNAEDR